MSNPFVYTRDAYIKQLTERYEADELIHVPMVFSKNVLSEMSEYVGDGTILEFTDAEFSSFVDTLINTDEFFDSADEIANEVLELLLKERTNNG